MHSTVRQRMAAVAKMPATVSYFFDDNYTCCVMRIVHDNQTHQGVGFAKCNPKDKYDFKLGLKIAEGRAVKRLAILLEGQNV